MEKLRSQFATYRLKSTNPTYNVFLDTKQQISALLSSTVPAVLNPKKNAKDFSNGTNPEKMSAQLKLSWMNLKLNL